MGNDFIVSLGCKFGPFENTLSTVSSSFVPNFDGDGDKNTRGYTKQIRGTFMHELGHNLGLKHGGPDKIRIANDGTVFDPELTNGDANVNCKPNYPSSMSYSRQLDTYLGTDYTLDFSNGTIGPIRETIATLEADGLTTTDSSETIVFGSLGATLGDTGKVTITGTASAIAPSLRPHNWPSRFGN